jgi:8-oxo-dGTP diphosphatase / 2-hydroxy-dATP diphosphatase
MELVLGLFVYHLQVFYNVNKLSNEILYRTVRILVPVPVAEPSRETLREVQIFETSCRCLAYLMRIDSARHLLFLIICFVASIPFLNCFVLRLKPRLFSPSRLGLSHVKYTTDSMEEKDFSLVFCRRESSEGHRELLLGMKKRGFGIGKWNGYGGKLEPNETIEQCAVRELQEECSITANNMTRKGYIVFKMIELNKILRVHVFESWDFSGEAIETEEMRPMWYKESEVPFDGMWPDDKFWLPLVLEGKSILARFVFEDEETILEHDVKVQE